MQSSFWLAGTTREPHERSIFLTTLPAPLSQRISYQTQSYVATLVSRSASHAQIPQVLDHTINERLDCTRNYASIALPMANRKTSDGCNRISCAQCAGVRETAELTTHVHRQVKTFSNSVKTT